MTLQRNQHCEYIGILKLLQVSNCLKWCAAPTFIQSTSL